VAPEVAAVSETAESAWLPPAKADLAMPSAPGSRASAFTPGRSAATLGAFTLVFPAAAADADPLAGTDAVVAAAADATNGAAVAMVTGALGGVTITGGCAGVEAAAEAAAGSEATVAAPATGAAGIAACAT
jgi:hypothetical protein